MSERTGAGSATMADAGVVLLWGLNREEAVQVAAPLKAAHYDVLEGEDATSKMRPDVVLARPQFQDEATEDTPPPWPADLVLPGVPIIALVPAARPDYIARAIDAGATEVLLLPANAVETLARVRKVHTIASLSAQIKRMGPPRNNGGVRGSYL